MSVRCTVGLLGVVCAIGVSEAQAPDSSDAKETVQTIWAAAQVFHTDKGKWPDSVDELERDGYITIASTMHQFWSFQIVGSHPEVIRAGSIEPIGVGEYPECPKYELTYDVLMGRWEGYGIPRYGSHALTPREQADVAANASNAMRAIWEGAQVYYNDKGIWPATVDALDVEHYIGTRPQGVEQNDESAPEWVSTSVFQQWQFAFIGNPPEAVVAISKKEMPDGAGWGIEYDVKLDTWRGYGSRK